MDKLIEAILKYGLLPTFLLIIIFLIVQDPNRAFKLKSLLISPFFKLFKWFKRAYIANEVAKYLNTFFSKELAIDSSNDSVSFKIDWVRSDADPILKGGKLIIRMRNDEDQAKNVLTATRYALPKVVCPLFRHNILPAYSTAIDFTFLHKLAGQLGNHGKAVFKKYFLDPESTSDPALVETLQKLIQLDKFGIFTSIFINELNHVGEGLYGDSDTKDRTSELIQFINYLSELANREIGEEIPLDNYSERFKVGCILLARSQRATKRGLIPYLRRLNINLEKGCDSIYIVAFPPAFKFLEKFIDVVDGNQRVNIERIYKTKEVSFLNRSTAINICSLRRNKLFTNESFVRKIEASDIQIGKYVQGTVVDCSTDEALISFLGVDGTIIKSECSWVSNLTCHDTLHIGEIKTFIVKNIDNSNGNISLSLRFPEEDPWKKIQIPKANDIIELTLTSRDNISFKGLFKDVLEVALPIQEVSWFNLDGDERDELLGKTMLAKVIRVEPSIRLIECSIRQMENDPWPNIHASLKPGTEFNGKVHEVSEHFVRVRIDNGLVGKVPRESLLLAGYEYSNYMENLVPGQGLEVVVTKVFINKKWIRLDLKRNIN